MTTVELEKPRWPGGPAVCPVENLPAFESKQAALSWHNAPNKTNPLYEANPIKKIGKCKHCGQWHFRTKMRPPSGASSGGGRQS